MPKPEKHLHPLRQKLLGGLIETQKSTTTVKTFVKDKDGKEQVVSTSTTRDVLRYPLAQNVSEQNVNRAAKGMIK